MKQHAKSDPGKNPFDLMEEAIHLLRLAPAETLALYFIGSVPFVLGLLYFWTDMSRSPLAQQHLPAAAFGISLLFTWMKCWQAVFAQKLLEQLGRDPLPHWTLRSVLNLILRQSSIHSTALFLLPVSLLLLAPFGWVYCFFQNVTVLGSVEKMDMPALIKKAWRQAMLWPMQNHAVLFCIQFFGAFVFLNWIAVLLGIPFLLKSLLGVETAVTQSPLAMLNSTFFASVLGLTYLCVDPILKATYVLRCFYGESLQSGQDLLAELKKLLPPMRLTALIFILFTSGTVQTGLAANKLNSNPTVPARPLPEGSSLSPRELDRTIEEVIRRREYAWRMSREQITQQKKADNVLARYLNSALESVQNALKAVGRWIEKFARWLDRQFRPVKIGKAPGMGWISGLQSLMYALLAVLGVTLLFLMLRWWKQRSTQPADSITTEALAPTPDITDENVGADQLPGQGWIKLAQDLLAQGELRLALRAFYLASLAHLAERNLVSIARYKSNRDYERELLRRAHAIPEVAQIFSQNVTVFDAIWYGLHAVDEDLVRQFATDVERIKAL